MASLSQYRMLGYSLTLAMHGVNSIIMLASTMDKRLMMDVQLQEIKSMQFQYFTVWNVINQLIYAGLGLSIEVLTLTKRDHLLPKYVKKIRDVYFTSIVFPGTLTVFTIFWPFFLYDRNLLFPEFIDKMFSPKSNYVIHFWIVPVVLWEIAFQPRLKPSSHKSNLLILTALFTLYYMRIFYVFSERGIWPYPIMKITYGTIYFGILHIFLGLICIVCYYIQLPLVNLFWGSEKSKKKVI